MTKNTKKTQRRIAILESIIILINSNNLYAYLYKLSRLTSFIVIWIYAKQCTIEKTG